jgi:hypothetical protein
MLVFESPEDRESAIFGRDGMRLLMFRELGRGFTVSGACHEDDGGMPGDVNLTLCDCDEGCEGTEFCWSTVSILLLAEVKACCHVEIHNFMCTSMIHTGTCRRY